MTAEAHEHTASNRSEEPFVYLPCATHVDDVADAIVEFRRLTDDRLALMAYTSLRQLTSCCGEQQPWLALPPSALEYLRQVQPFDLVLFDVVIPQEHRTIPPSSRPKHSGT
ncbi:SAV_915 family protein [Saccharomonospora cyanea]|uniref:SseB protein N-terminal domain-containing protein n=1 Tax=Saccharomonospora cyanea NA-134 TaxID=882082 RepID=H5XNL6_9PSEU|nr:SAV_915 family protein [Saccharomonospora cyanea]EHR61077.1 hypothetical protein SaccyDRAFT_2192 [Saccharomonospora cyanea NA-134]